MLDVGMGELALIAAVGVLVLGPEKCVDLFRKAGKIWRTVRAELAVAEDALKGEEKTIRKDPPSPSP